MKKHATENLKVLLFSLCACIITSCGSQKDTAGSKGMQNLSARYNYLYNANSLLTNHQLELAETYVDNYDQVLPVYLGPETDNTQANVSLNLKSMDGIIKKAQTIILEKSFSNYLDDSYILLGKANFFNGNYFNAVEYFDYTTKAYKKNLHSYLEALNWKARSLMQLNRISEANNVLDSLEAVIPQVKSKRHLAEPFATLAQMCSYLNNDAAAISYLKDAIKASNQNQHKIRWTYILAQLYEKQKDNKNALLNYRKVVKSNAPYGMYFNANLNQIKLKAIQSGTETDTRAQMLALLKDDKNLDFNDQVYFQLAESHAATGAYNEAEKHYLLSIQKSTVNAYQKGLAYLRIADLQFKQFRNYLKAKNYYDSTVNALPKNYPGYDLILKKSQNLEYLTKRYEVIALEDTLQAVAKLPEGARSAKIQELLKPQVSEKAENTTAQPYSAQVNTTAIQNNKSVPQNSFYFSNPAAISMGFSDFKRKWGSRKLENNWRQSIKTSSQETTQELAANTATLPAGQDPDVAMAKDKTTLEKQYNDNLPITAELLATSNQKIIDAYYEIASFYLQELNDPKEAEAVYQILLSRFPANNHRAAIYYSLFLIHKETDKTKANDFKMRLTQEFPTSAYARTLLDPSFSLRQSELETAANKQYNEIFSKYLQKDFQTVIQGIDAQENTHGANYLSPQFAYLKAIAIGRTNNTDTLLLALNDITTRFPEDKLITPLVKEHLIYINQHLAAFKKRKIALVDFDPNEPPFMMQQPLTTAVTEQPQTVAGIPSEKRPEIAQKSLAPKPDNSVAQPIVPVEKPLIPIPAKPTETKVASPFSTASSSTYYFVIDVSDASLTLSSSRFGIGQFNRGSYAGSNLKHQLKEFDNEQLIFVGNFTNFEEAKTYASGITPQLKQIMKVPVNMYSSFIISKENFDKLTNKTMLDKYLEFYKNNY